ncbi:hypothetical protein Ddc_24888 [Ditylenchus destructor]|nr:hypothetical protein Ddc_24888 [Ditylenchus destructor]
MRDKGTTSRTVNALTIGRLPAGSLRAGRLRRPGQPYWNTDCRRAKGETRGAGISRRPASLAPFSRSARARQRRTRPLEPVDEQIQAQPNHVHEVPVPGRAFEAEVMVGGEMAAHQADQDDRQHRGAQDHVEPVKAGQHVEQRPIGARIELEVQLGIGVVVFGGLAGHEDEAQDHRGGQPEHGLAAMVFTQRVVGDGQRHARAEQQRGVDRGQPEGADRLEVLDHARGAEVGPHGLEVGPQHQAVVHVTQPRRGDGAHVPEGAEERGEEHHFRENEPAHAPTVGTVDALAVHAGFGFLDGVAEPVVQDDDQRDESRQHRPFGPAYAVDPARGAQAHEQQRHGRAHGVPRVGGHEVVRCLFSLNRVACTHGFLPAGRCPRDSLRPCGHRKTPTPPPSSSEESSACAGRIRAGRRSWLAADSLARQQRRSAKYGPGKHGNDEYQQNQSCDLVATALLGCHCYAACCVVGIGLT